MRLYGIHYDVGTHTVEGGTTRETLPREVCEREMRAIARDLHATAVRSGGHDPERLPRRRQPLNLRRDGAGRSRARQAVGGDRVRLRHLPGRSRPGRPRLDGGRPRGRPPRPRPGIVRLDAAAFGLVRAWPDGRSEPKAAFRALAAHFLAHRHA
jgi:hypothetical protein